MKKLAVFLSLLVLASMVLSGCGHKTTIAEGVKQEVVEPDPNSITLICDDVHALLEPNSTGGYMFTLIGGKSRGYPGEVRSLKSLGVRIRFVDGSSVKLRLKPDSTCTSKTILSGFTLGQVAKVTTSVKEYQLRSVPEKMEWFFAKSIHREFK